MKLQVLSDLHLEFGSFEPKQTDADVVVLAGDVATGAKGLRWARRAFPHSLSLCIAGNHEYYGSNYQHVLRQCQEAAGEGTLFLENASAVIGGVRFVGCTLWSDFRLYGDGDRQRVAMDMAREQISDFRQISFRDSDGTKRRFTPMDAAFLHQQSRTYLGEALAAPFDGPTIVVSHFLPGRASIAEEFIGDPLNPYFCSDLTELMEEHEPAVWVHGHTHSSCDYRVGKTRVVCNPRGYAPSELNPHFDPVLTVDI